jgi:hypothetical protein
MSITDELRKWAEDNTLRDRELTTYPPQHVVHGVLETLLCIADRIDAEHEAKVSYWQGASYKDGYDEGFASADDCLAQHEDAMAEHGWVRGPLDADGKMWRSGDMSDSNWGVIEGIAYEDGRWLISGHDTSAPWVPADSIRHYHEPTVEDVLRDVVTLCHNTWKEESPFHFYDVDDVMKSGNIAEFISRLRLAGEGE